MLLTGRGRQVFKLIAVGKTNPEGAISLGISVRTVEVHRVYIMDKLNLKTHIDFVRFAFQYGILADEKQRISTSGESFLQEKECMVKKSC